jgi:3-methyladenine DNA glycosylase AlkD
MVQSKERNDIIADLEKLGNREKAEFVQRFFKTGEGQYAQGDIFWGIPVPSVRKIARQYRNLKFEHLEKLLTHEVHEIRLCALLIMVFKSKYEPKLMYDLYLEKTIFINNWDLVDLSAAPIVGNFLINFGNDTTILYTLAKSPSLWERRVAIVATFAFIKQGVYLHTLKLAQILMHDKHDLIHKAVGWMLREVGKRCSARILETFLKKHASTMPRTMLRYAIEHMQPEKKQYFMKAKRRENVLKISEIS